MLTFSMILMILMTLSLQNGCYGPGPCILRQLLSGFLFCFLIREENLFQEPSANLFNLIGQNRVPSQSLNPAN